MESIVRVRSELTESRRASLDTLATWPVRVVTSDGSFIAGILMRLIPQDYFCELNLYEPGSSQRVLNGAQYLAQAESDLDGPPYLSLSQRMEFLTSLARSLSLIHQQKLVYGDLSLLNVVCSVGRGKANAMLVDCDSVMKSGTTSLFGRQPHSPGFEPPEAVEAGKRMRQLLRSGASKSSPEVRRYDTDWATQTYRTDVYKFALMVLRVLDHGRGSSLNRNPTRAAERLPKEFRDLFLSSLSPNPEERPKDMRVWGRALTGRSAASSTTGRASTLGVAPAQRRSGNFRQRSDGSWVRSS